MARRKAKDNGERQGISGNGNDKARMKGKGEG